jgi:hypothetical protein
VELIIYPAAGSPMKILSSAYPANYRFPNDDFVSCAPGKITRRRACRPTLAGDDPYRNGGVAEESEALV